MRRAVSQRLRLRLIPGGAVAPHRPCATTGDDLLPAPGGLRPPGAARSAPSRTVAVSDGADDFYGYWRPRIQVRDASFSLKPTRTQSVYFVDYDQGWGVGEDVVPGKGGQSTFNDSKSYWYAEAPEAGVKIPRNLGVRIIVKSMNDDAMTIRVDNVK